ncbi:hypothetical protein Syun_031074 [Stephania yunnanensis]|uniref:Uncharacterized protein n=1 Tax=Stephania yunnanensis TaxID=152371 RepID=A0AAP0HEW4_9MAGN
MEDVGNNYSYCYTTPSVSPSPLSIQLLHIFALPLSNLPSLSIESISCHFETRKRLQTTSQKEDQKRSQMKLQTWLTTAGKKIRVSIGARNLYSIFFIQNLIMVCGNARLIQHYAIARPLNMLD